MKRMSIKQKRAISYAISKRKKEKQEEYLKSNNLLTDFQKSRYKTMTWYLKSRGIYIY